MKMGVQFLAALTVLALTSSIASAADPNPLQDFCVAANGTKNVVFVNGKACKDPKLAVPDDFSTSGIQLPRNTSNRLGTNATMFGVNAIPGLNTLGISVARIDFDVGGVNSPHFHPRASEILVVIEGTLYAGFVTSDPDNRLFSKVLNEGDAFVFPMGLIHFQLNLGNTSALAMSSFGSQSAGRTTVANTIFGSNPAINVDVLTKAFQLDEDEIERLQELSWRNDPIPRY
ncbi:germin-like protein subfamily 1 member 11 [Malania oleifera]|uniref:germin-like protein subfamily 1 member 11 n=1 Tax=Malania oleifera TaxID=397392 RepID=UPI0025AE4C61|nr:germin-like protein subfamily 1 member 11 [Malania oleifera]